MTAATMMPVTTTNATAERKKTTSMTAMPTIPEMSLPNHDFGCTEMWITRVGRDGDG